MTGTPLLCSSGRWVAVSENSNGWAHLKSHLTLCHPGSWCIWMSQCCLNGLIHGIFSEPFKEIEGQIDCQKFQLVNVFLSHTEAPQSFSSKLELMVLLQQTQGDYHCNCSQWSWHCAVSRSNRVSKLQREQHAVQWERPTQRTSLVIVEKSSGFAVMLSVPLIFL